MRERWNMEITFCWLSDRQSLRETGNERYREHKTKIKSKWNEIFVNAISMRFYLKTVLHEMFDSLSGVCAAFSMDFNLFHDCQECLFTIHLHFPFCMLPLFLFCAFFRPNSFIFQQWFDITIRLNFKKVQNAIFINILIRLKRHESRWFLKQIHAFHLHKLENFLGRLSEKLSMLSIVHFMSRLSLCTLILLMLVMKLRNFFLKYPWNKVNWKSQCCTRATRSDWCKNEQRKL